MPTTPRHCPGLETFKDLKAFVCRCNNCGEKKEVFSDEFERPHKCHKCEQFIDFTTCEFEAGGLTRSPR